MSNQRYDVSRAASPVSEIDDIVAWEERVAPKQYSGCASPEAAFGRCCSMSGQFFG